MKKLTFFVIFTLFLSIIFSSCTVTEEIEKNNDYLVYDYENFNPRHAQWMSRNADFYFANRDSVKLIEKEKTELNFSGVYLHFVGYKLDGVVVRESFHSRERNLPLTVIFYAFFIILFLGLIYFRFKNINDNFMEAVNKSFVVGLRYYSVFLLIFFLILSDLGAQYDFPIANPIVIGVVILAVFFSMFFIKKEKAGGEEDLRYSSFLIFFALTISLYLFTEIVLVFQMTIIILVIFFLSLFLPRIYKLIKEA